MGLIQIIGIIAGVLAIIAGILVIIRPRMLNWVISIAFVLFGIFAIISAISLR